MGVVEQTRPSGVRSRSRPRGQVELAQDVGDVAMDGVLAHHQPRSDLPVRETLGKMAQNLALARRDPRRPRAIAPTDRALKQAAGALGFGIGPQLHKATSRGSSLAFGINDATQ